jgi:hypothetical protein
MIIISTKETVMSDYTKRYGASRGTPCYVENRYGYSGPAKILRCEPYKEYCDVLTSDGTELHLPQAMVFLSKPEFTTYYTQFGEYTGYEETDIRYRYT